MDSKELQYHDYPFNFTTGEMEEINNRIISGQLSNINGGAINEFEDQSAKHFGNQYGVATSNGSSAIYLALAGCAVSTNTEVIVPTYCFHGAVVTICQLGATPVFCDIDPDTLTIDVEHAKKLITDKTKAILVLHPWGNVADIDALLELKHASGVALVSDSSHAHSAYWGGKVLGTYFDAIAASFGMNKLISGGELGVLTTDSSEIRDHAILRAHTNRINGNLINPAPFNVTNAVGIKMRPHGLALDIGILNLKRFEKYSKVIINNFNDFAEATFSSPISLPKVFDKAQRSLWKPVVFCQNNEAKEKLFEIITELGFTPEKHNYKNPLHLNPIFKDYFSVSTTETFPGFDSLDENVTHIPHEIFFDSSATEKLIAQIKGIDNGNSGLR